MPLFKLLQFFLAFLNYLWIVDVWHEHIMLPMSWISISTIFELLIVFGLSQEAVRAGSKGAQTHNRARICAMWPIVDILAAPYTTR